MYNVFQLIPDQSDPTNGPECWATYTPPPHAAAAAAAAAQQQDNPTPTKPHPPNHPASSIKDPFRRAGPKKALVHPPTLDRSTAQSPSERGYHNMGYSSLIGWGPNYIQRFRESLRFSPK
ncbi:hypothetical protein PGTUg99_024675 [Puccinia graminis f. sp. tritici]|uniref:Uncharacterized protein n=1 Tax=Puccinia graminis f. sp. tritici TaxID=56615 RepID=A0A5B0PJT5_PUCGR|nr:hypothetical protein PGTUg99_024675 [Puccinia graminis f. sp. tritici]